MKKNDGKQDEMKKMNTTKKSEGVKTKDISLITDEITNRRLVVFVGAGCSRSVGLPSWTELIGILLKKYNIKTKKTDLIQLADRLERELGGIKFREEVVQQLRFNWDKISRLHDTLIYLETYLYITTNYDSILEDYFKFKGIYPTVIYNIKDIPTINPSQKTIVKLHGDINSPSSLILTSKDYRDYKAQNKEFIDWFKNQALEKSILFIGTSFDDPRLKDTDDFVFNIFGRNRRQPFIFLKRPERAQEVSDEEFNTIRNDFEADLEDFRERGFYTILVSEYEEIAVFLEKVNRKVNEDKSQRDSSNLEFQLRLKTDQIQTLEKSQSELLHEKILESKEKIYGNGHLPAPNQIEINLKRLIDLLEDSSLKLNRESQLEGEITASDALMIISSRKDDIVKARHYYERANHTLVSLAERSNFVERMSRLKAKLLYMEGKIDEAIDSISASQEPRTISFWLSLLVHSSRFDGAYKFIEKKGIKPEWVKEAIYILVYRGEIKRAEDLFCKTEKEFDAQKHKGNLEKSVYRNAGFIERLCFAMIDALYHKALLLTGKEDKKKIYPSDLTDESKTLCQKTLGFLDIFREKTRVLKPQESYLSKHALLIEMNVASLLGKKERAEKNAIELADMKPIDKEVVMFLLNDLDAFKRDLLERVTQKLGEEYPDQSWSYMPKAIILASLKHKEEAWENLKNVFTFPPGEDEKFEVITQTLRIGGLIGKLEEAFNLAIQSKFFNEGEIQLLEGFYNWQIGKPQKALKIFNGLNEVEVPVEFRAKIKTLKAQNEAEKGNLEAARKILYEALAINKDPFPLRLLLDVLAKLQDDGEALKVAELIESFGFRDDQITYIKAHAARNLYQLETSEKAWRKLCHNHPENAEFTFGLSKVLYFQGRSREALKVLNPFIEEEEKIDSHCILLAAEIYKFEGKIQKAFKVIDQWIDRFQDNPDVLIQHLNLGFKTGRDEKKAEESLQRLITLQKEGKVSEEVFQTRSFDDFVKLFQARQQEIKVLNELYRAGKLSRFLLSEENRNPLYLDWAVRTQEISLEKLKPSGWVDFTIYATNYIQVNVEQKKLIPIQAPTEAEEIVIDYHALITLHRLGMLKRALKRYKKIYYPEILKIQIWKNDLLQYANHQPKKLKIFKSLKEKLEKGDIIEATAPIGDRETGLTTKDLNLARLEKIPLIDNYTPKKELTCYADVPVIRLAQLLDWLYEKGRLGEKVWRNYKKDSKGESPVSSADWKVSLTKLMRVIIAQITLELMEEFDLIRVLRETGIQIYIEKTTGDSIRFNLLNGEFVIEVETWHRDLNDRIGELTKLEPMHCSFKSDEKALRYTPYIEAMFTSLKYAQDNHLYLLTDDRCTQMQHVVKFVNKQFGTDALLTDLFNKKIINLEEYAKAFYQLTIWRYRFIIPEVPVLTYFAKQHKNNLPGAELEKIATYFRQSLKDPGLFLRLEPTEPPQPFGLRYYSLVLETWHQFLVEIWQDEDFEERQLNNITHWFYCYAFPELPTGIPKEIKIGFNKRIPRVLIQRILSQSMFSTSNHFRLHGLLKKSFEYILEKPEDYEEELINYIRFIKNLEFSAKINPKGLDETPKLNFKREAIVKIFESYYGKPIDKIEFTPTISRELDELIPVMPAISSKLEGLLELNIVDGYDAQEGVRFLAQGLDDYLEKSRDMPSYEASPFIPLRKTDNKIFGNLLHQLILHPNLEIKNRVIAIITNANNITGFTKNNAKKLTSKGLCSKKIFQAEASEKVKRSLLRDFKYNVSLFLECMEKQGIEDIFNEIWPSLLRPNLETVLDEPPLLLEKKLEWEDIKKQIEEKLSTSHRLDTFLEWYLNQCFFIPVGGPLSPGNFINELIDMKKNVRKNKLKGGHKDLKSKDKGDEPLFYYSFYKKIKDWLGKSTDPFVYLAALDIVLNLHSHELEMSEYERSIFKDEDFFRFINKTFEVLGLERDSTTAENRDLVQTVNIRWDLHLDFVQYYLMYIDLNIRNMRRPLEEEEKIVLAWWMAGTIDKAMWNTCQKISLERSNFWLTRIRGKIDGEKSLIKLRHSFIHKESKMSIGRYYVLHSTVQGTLFLASLSLSILNQHNDQNKAFQGLIKKLTTFNSKFEDKFFEFLMNPRNIGNGQVSEGKRGKLNYLWEIPMLVTAPAFLRAYYQDEIKYLGKERLDVIVYAEKLGRSEFFKEQMLHFSEMLDDQRGMDIFILLNIMITYVHIHGDIPASEVEILKKEKKLISKMIAFNPPLNYRCIQIFISILYSLESIGHSKGAQIFGKMLMVPELTEMQIDEENLTIIIGQLVNIVIFGYDIALLAPFLRKRHIDEMIRQILGKMKGFLESIFTELPFYYRSNVRKILNEIADVPLSSDLDRAL